MPEGLAIATFVQQQQQLGEQANIQSSSRGSTPGGLQPPVAPPALEPGERVVSMAGSVYNVPPDHSHYTRGREVGLLMEVPGVRRMEDRGEERRRRDEIGEDRRRRGIDDLMELEGEEEARAAGGEHVEFRPRRLRHPWTEEKLDDVLILPHMDHLDILQEELVLVSGEVRTMGPMEATPTPRHHRPTDQVSSHPNTHRLDRDQ